jgi:Iodothyronine deiodinase
MDSNREQKFVFQQPKTLAERSTLARLLPDRLKYRIPVAVDPIEAPAEKAFAAWPERIYILSSGGRVLYKAEPGPFGFKPDDAEAALKKLFAG